MRLKVLKAWPLKVIIGAATTQQAGWISTNVTDLNLVEPKTWLKFFGFRRPDAILAEHVWEHLSPADALTAAKNCFHFLKRNGYIRIAVPDGYFPDPRYIEQVRPNGSGLGSDDHKILYNWKTIKTVFENAGFEVNLIEYFDELGHFIQKPWSTNDGMILRSKDFDERNINGEIKYTSIILDAIKK